MKKILFGLLVAVLAIAAFPSVVTADDAPPITDEIVLTDNYVTADLEMELVPSVEPMEFDVSEADALVYSLSSINGKTVFAERPPILKVKFLDSTLHANKSNNRSFPHYKKRLMYFQLE